MFGRKTKNENVVVVTTKEELKAAIKSKKPNIEVHGDLAKKMKWMTKLRRAAIVALMPILLSLAAIGGSTAGVVAVPAAVIGSAISSSIVISIIKGYNIEADAKGVLRLTKGGKNVV